MERFTSYPDDREHPLTSVAGVHGSARKIDQVHRCFSIDFAPMAFISFRHRTRWLHSHSHMKIHPDRHPHERFLTAEEPIDEPLSDQPWTCFERLRHRHVGTQDGGFPPSTPAWRTTIDSQGVPGCWLRMRADADADATSSLVQT